MAPLIALLLTYAVAAIALRQRCDRLLPGRVALAVMLVMTGVTHFTRTASLAAMVPLMLPSPELLVIATGVAELGFALILLARPTPALGRVLALLFVALLPANIHSAIAEVGYGGHGAAYLWFRVPLQALFIAWALYFTRSEE